MRKIPSLHSLILLESDDMALYQYNEVIQYDRSMIM